jgi:hypothetical protein
MKKNKIVGVYFVALLNEWEPIVKPQINRLFNSNLYKETDELHVRVFFNDNEELYKFRTLLKNDKKILLTLTKKNEYEFGALRILKNLSKKEDFYGYYLHAKGVSRTMNKQLSKCVKSWREYMEYFLIDKYDLCVKELDNGWDAAGVKIRRTPGTDFFHFSGNFWWANSKFIRELPEIDSLDLNKRHDAEFWIGYTKGKLKCLHDTKQASIRTIITENYKF